MLNAHILTSCLRKRGVQQTCPEEPWLSTAHPCPSLPASVSPRGGEVAAPGPHLPKRQEASSPTQVLKTLVEMSYCNWLTLGSIHTSVARMCRLLPKGREGCWANKKHTTPASWDRGWVHVDNQVSRLLSQVEGKLPYLKARIQWTL